MKTKISFLAIFLFLLAIQFTFCQNSQKLNNQSPANSVTKAQDHKSSKTNKSTVANPAKAGTMGKKGYDYYMAKSDMNYSNLQNDPQSHNSSGSNNAENIVSNDINSGEGDLNEKALSPNNKTDKNAVARAKRK